MKIRFTTNTIHGGKINAAGSEIDVAKEIAQTLIDNGVAIDPKAKPAKDGAEGESAGAGVNQ